MIIYSTLIVHSQLITSYFLIIDSWHGYKLLINKYLVLLTTKYQGFTTYRDIIEISYFVGKICY